MYVYIYTYVFKIMYMSISVLCMYTRSSHPFVDEVEPWCFLPIFLDFHCIKYALLKVSSEGSCCHSCCGYQPSIGDKLPGINIDILGCPVGGQKATHPYLYWLAFQFQSKSQQSHSWLVDDIILHTLENKPSKSTMLPSGKLT